MTLISRNVYIDKLDEINTTMLLRINTIIYIMTIKMKSINIKSSTYINFGIENN